MKDFRKFSVWEKAHDLVLAIYRPTVGFPPREAYGLTAQLRRASVSVPSNIAEGCGRTGDAELARFLQIAMGSASEVEYQLLLCRDLGLLSGKDYALLTDRAVEVKRMLASLLRRLTSDARSQTPAS